MTLPKLPFALKNNILVDINDVSSGLACHCNCPGCGEPLIAKKGDKMVHHFAHKPESNCTHALETALHLKAKDILKKAQQFMLPEVRIRNNPTPVYEAQVITYEKVLLEKKTGNIIPDLMIKSQNKWLFIEIAVRHFTGKEKIKTLRKLGHAAIEIDAAALLKRIQKGQQFFQSHRFANFLLFSTKYKKWLFNPRQRQLENKLRETATKKDVKELHFPPQKVYITENCPLDKNTYRRGYKTGTSYANVFRDCLNCEQCIEIEYEKYFFGSREVNGKPERVVCAGK